jgi:hypothetical protein
MNTPITAHPAALTASVVQRKPPAAVGQISDAA